MGEILSFSDGRRRAPEKAALAQKQKWQEVLPDREGDLRTRTIDHIKHLPNESLLVVYRMAKVLRLVDRER